MERDRWLGVELRHLAALEAVARTRSFGAAARDLGYTQSAVSQQIAQLERNVGVRLVDRPGGPRQVDLTDAGRLLLRHADAIVAQLDAAKADMAALAEGAAGPLRVGIYQSVGARILPALLRRFQEEFPRVEVQVKEETDAADLLRLLEHGELDLTFADLPLNIVFRSDDNGTLTGLVAEGLGVAVVPQLVVNPRNPAVVALPFGSRIPPRHLAIVSHRDRYRSAAADAFAALARELGEDWMRRSTESSSASAASTSRRPAR